MNESCNFSDMDEGQNSNNDLNQYNFIGFILNQDFKGKP